MLGLLVCFGGLLAAGLFFLAADLPRLPYLKTSKAMINTGRGNREAAKSLETYLLPPAVRLAPYAHMDECKRGRQKNILKASGLSMEPEVYQAYVIPRAGLVLLGIIPCLLAFPLLAVIVAVLAVMMYFKEQKRTDELLTKKGGELEDELPRFVSTVEQELRDSRDALSIVENYKKNTGEGFANELEVLATDMHSFSYKTALAQSEARISSLMLSDAAKGLTSVLCGDDGAMYFQMLFRDFKQVELQRLKKEAQKISPKIQVFSFLTLVCFTVTYLVIIIPGILKSVEGMLQKRKRRRRKSMNGVKNQTGMAEREVENESGRKLSETARESLERHPREPVSMMTSSGYVYLVSEQIGNLLAGGTVFRGPYSWRECIQIRAEELLQQMMDSVNYAGGTWYVLTRLYEPEVIPVRTSEEGMVCHVQGRLLLDVAGKSTLMWRF